MDNQPAKNPTRGALMRLWPWLIVLLVLAFVGFIRVRLLDIPLERDEGEYAYAGQLILQGIPPYELAYNMKLPGTYYAYAVGMAVFGQSSAGVHLALMAVNSLTVVFVFLLGRKLFGVTAGLVACASYGVMSVSPTVVGMAAHATHFVVLFAVPATLLLLHAEENKKSLTLFFSGLLYGLAYLMVQQGICFCVFGCLALVWRAVADKTIFSMTFVRRGLLFGLGIVLPYAIFCLACLVAGDFDRFWFWTFVYARSYATVLPWSEGVRQLEQHLQLSRNVSLGLWILAMLGPLLAWLDRDARKRIMFAVVLWGCSFLGVALGLYFRPHYFVLVLPAFAILTGLAVVSLQRVLRFNTLANVFQSLPLILFATVLGWTVYYQAQFLFQLSPVQICRSLYQENPFQESIAAADYIRTHAAPDARIAVVGSEPEIYFYAHRHSATGYIYTYALMEPQPAASAMQREMIQEIETNQPEYLVQVSCGLSWLFQAHSDRMILDWLQQYAGRFYEPVGFVHLNSAGEVEGFWDAAAASQIASGGTYLMIYKRRPNTATAPAQSN